MENSIHASLDRYGVAVPEILLPAPGVDLEGWAVIACDQYTQDRDYWKRVAGQLGDRASALHLIFPEIYLEDGGREERIRAIHRAMEAYLGNGTLSSPGRGIMYIERSTPLHPCRKGLILVVDLEKYDWKADSRPLIRATEGTVPERIPPRMEIRRNAALESPHIILLIDDDQYGLLDTLGDRAKEKEPAYSTRLMENSGHVSGWFLDEQSDWELLAAGLEELNRRAESRYGSGGGDAPFLFAVGDGNHSLATAKAVWEEYKAAHAGETGLAGHPARWALVELENLYDPGIAFEPIHRIIFGTDIDELSAALSVLSGFTCRSVGDRAELSRLVGDRAAKNQRYGLIGGGKLLLAEADAPGIATDALQPLLDTFVAGDRACSGDRAAGDKTLKKGAAEKKTIDYIHGEDELFRLSAGPAAGCQEGVGILLPPVKKEDLFKTVAASGPLPRKSFSMGEAFEKRFYLECRRLFG